MSANLSSADDQLYLKNRRDKTKWSKWRLANFEFFKKYLEDQDKNKVLLDVGAGPIHFHELFFQFQYIGADFEAFPNVQIVTDLTKEIPLQQDSVDIVVASNFFEHIPNPEFVIKECFRVLKPGGIFLGTIPFLYGVHQAPYDFFRYTNFMIEKMLVDSSFVDIEIKVLNNTFDTFFTLQNIFFREIFKIPHNRILGLLRKLIDFEFKIFKKLYTKKANPTSDSFHLGYGFKAIKK